MANQIERIPSDLAEAFCQAVLEFQNWTPSGPEVFVSLRGQPEIISVVCGLVDRFVDRMPDDAIRLLFEYSATIDTSELAIDPSYRNGARHLLRLMSAAPAK